MACPGAITSARDSGSAGNNTLRVAYIRLGEVGIETFLLLGLHQCDLVWHDLAMSDSD